MQLQDNMYIVNEGLKGGETVVSEGLIKIRPGMKVVAQVKDFALPATVTQAAPANAAPVVDIEDFDEAIQRDEKSDVQSLPTPQTNDQPAAQPAPNTQAK